MNEIVKKELDFKDFSEWAQSMQAPPDESMVKLHDHISVKRGKKWEKYQYLDADYLRAMLRHFFLGLHKVTVLEAKQVINAAVVTVRLEYFHPFIKEWMHHDGIAAIPFQTDKDASPMDIDKIKSNAAVLAFPAAKSVALKNACAELGPKFGANLNKDISSYGWTPNKSVAPKPIEDVL